MTFLNIKFNLNQKTMSKTAEEILQDFLRENTMLFFSLREVDKLTIYKAMDEHTKLKTSELEERLNKEIGSKHEQRLFKESCKEKVKELEKEVKELREALLICHNQIKELTNGNTTLIEKKSLNK